MKTLKSHTLKKKKSHVLKMLLGDKFGTSSLTHTTSSITFEDQGQAELAWYKAEPQSTLDHNPLLRWHDHTSRVTLYLVD